MSNEDFSFLVASEETTESNIVDPLAFLIVSDNSIVVAPAVSKDEDTPLQAKSLPMEPQRPRNQREWDQLLTRLKKEKNSAWLLFDYERGLDFRNTPRSAEIHEIETAKSNLLKIRKEIQVTRRRLASWWWSPFAKWPLLQCHILATDKSTPTAIRFTTRRMRDAYMNRLLSSLKEDESFNLAIAKAVSPSVARNKSLLNQAYWNAKRRFGLADNALKQAQDDFQSFQKNGPLAETDNDAAARRLDGYLSNASGLTAGVSSQLVTGSGSRGSTGGQTQGHHPPGLKQKP